MSNISAEPTAMNVLLENRAIETVLEFLRNESAYQPGEGGVRFAACGSAVWTLGNIAGHDDATRLKILELDGFQIILDHLIVPLHEIERLMRTTMWTMSNLAKIRPLPSYVRSWKNKNSETVLLFL